MKITLQFFLTIITILLLTVAGKSQTGKISGTVKDISTGEALPFVNIIVEETNYGAASDVDGNYAMIGIPPATYSIKASAIGYNSVEVRDVRVSIDLTTKIDFELGRNKC